jgi:hypothetical protein
VNREVKSSANLHKDEISYEKKRMDTESDVKKSKVFSQNHKKYLKIDPNEDSNSVFKTEIH